MHRLAALLIITLCALVGVAVANEGAASTPEIAAPAAPRTQTAEEAEAKSAGCKSCHTASDQASMHQNPGVVLGCTDCHGGNAHVSLPVGAKKDDAQYMATLRQAHVLPRNLKAWNWPHSANPEHSFTLLNHESAAFIRFMNPGDYRVAREACGACHLPIVEATERSMMSTGVMLWGGAAYNNGILPFKHYVTGEAYTQDGKPAAIFDPSGKPDANMTAKGVLPGLYPLPTWETTPPGDVFRVFEGGGRNIGTLFAELGLPDSTGELQKLEEPGRPDIRQSNRGPGTGLRVAIPVLNITKTRLNDPFMWFLGTNDNPGDYRSSGCSGCHVVYANDRDPLHSGPYAKFGNEGLTQTVDPTIPRQESGHPLTHSFTRAIPTAQCMNCHMHQPNIFLNSMLGYTMWDYESDAPFLWPKKEAHPTDAQIREINERNPEEAAIRGNWGDPEFLKHVAEINPQLKDTQFADYHGHGWNFRGIFKRDKKGDLLDKDGQPIGDTDPDKWHKAVQLMSIHVQKGMQCTDCHFEQDAHGNGHLVGEVAQAVEIDCQDCHGTVDQYPALRTTGPAAPPQQCPVNAQLVSIDDPGVRDALMQSTPAPAITSDKACKFDDGMVLPAPPPGTDLSALRTQDGRRRFEWINGQLWQRSAVSPNLEWRVKLVKDTVNPASPDYNAKAARAKLMSMDTKTQAWGQQVAPQDRAHKNDEMLCVTCHSSWTTSCFGCHLPIQANWKTERHHFEGGESRNFATYNPQVARDDFYMLGVHGPVKGFRIAPIRSSSALILSSTNVNRERIYTQQPPVSAIGFSSQAFAPHYPHTERTTETKTCSDCHLSDQNDNNAWMTSLLGMGTGFVNFVGFHAYTGLDGGLAAVQVTEWDEPQAVIGSYLQRYAYPERYAAHEKNQRELTTAELHGTGDAVGCLQLRGEYLYSAEGRKGLQVYDVASISNKDISEKIITAPFSPLGHDTHIASKDASCVALPTNQPISPLRNTPQMRADNLEQPFREIYHYALVSDRLEGLILTNVDTLQNGEARDNFLKRALTFNPNGLLNGARHLTIAGDWVYVVADTGVVVLNLEDPLKPKVIATIPLKDARATAVQFRYLFVTTAGGLQTVDITHPQTPKIVDGALVPLNHAQRVYLARTFAYVADGKDGLAIVDIQNPEKPKLYQLYTADGKLDDVRDVIVGSTNASLFAYVADGKHGLHVIQLTAPDTQPKFYGFSPDPKPNWIAWYQTGKPALSLSRGLDRDRAVDESGGQVAIFGRIGSRPFHVDEMQKFYMNPDGSLWTVSDSPPGLTAAK